MNGIQTPESFENYCKFYKDCNLEEPIEEMYEEYLEDINMQNECWNKTRHRSQKYKMGCYFCLDCGATYV